MEQQLIHYLADSAIADLRAGRLKATSVLSQLNKPPVIDVLRTRIERADIQWLKPMAQDRSRARFALAISLFRNIQADADVRHFLLNVWRSNASYYRRWWTMFRLLDYRDLPSEIHSELFRFTTRNWKRWLRDQIQNFGGPANILRVVEARLRDKSWPKSRTWERVLSSLGASDDKSVAAFLAYIRANRLQSPLVKEALAFAATRRPKCV